MPLDRPWESCITMGTEWPYKPAHEQYKSGTQLLEMLIETRAKGGNLLLNVGPKPDGELPTEQEQRLQQIALWNFTFGEAIQAVRPWVVTNEGNVWFTKKKDEDTVYAFVTKTPWTLGDRKTFTLRSVKTSAATKVTILGQTGEVLEYKPDVDPRPRWKQTDSGLELDVMMAQRLYTDRRWLDPVVLKITHATPGLRPPVVVSVSAARKASGAVVLTAKLEDLGQATSVEVGFQYRRKKGVEELYTPDEPWTDTALVRKTAAGEYTVEVTGLKAEEAHDYRAVVKHPLLTSFGEEKVLAARPR